MNALIKLISRKLNVDANYFLKGGFWLLVAQGSTILSSLLAAVFFANYLTDVEYGTYRYIIGLAVLLSSFSMTGIAQSILLATSTGHKEFLRASTATTMRWSLGIVAFSLLGAAYYFLQGNQTLSIGCLLIAVLQPVNQLFSNVQSYLQGLSKFKSGTIMQTVKSVFVSGTSILALFITHSILLLLAVYFISQALASIVSYWFYLPKEKGETLSKAVWDKYISFGKHSSVRNTVTGFANRIDSIMIFQLLGAGDLALYSIATLLPEHIRGSFKNLQTLLLPKYAKHDSIKSLKKYIPKRSLQFLLILVIFTILFLTIVPSAYTLLFPKYIEAIPYVQLLALTFPASIFLIPLGALQAQRLEKELYWYETSTSIIQVASLIIFIPLFGFAGAIISRIVTQYSRTIITFVLLFRNRS